ncbi:3-oxoacyl-[acyl-carrier-protein] synthase 2 [Caloramator mitchellensis]|uniref:3-oxoacyl-[acyl-carrier-protein] synthase 2 n=1 Tax=Caloramator mitchellensis TaxID=908809 RepID=A0A0R3K009_CALMK|nr:beta-ketoacyl-ACP synthase II [Caloramator mitchellensis]KRQ87869.1 3-oxoacyl-[acyl-carrier-protein] synthase 2 [Caloramator mitchellensis]
MKRRVVITGLGAVTPIGNNVADFWKSIKEGKCGIDIIKSFDTESFKVKVAAEVKDFDAAEFLDRKESKRMDRFCQFAMVAADEAIKDSNIDLEKIDKNRFGVVIGSGIGGLSTIEKENTNLNQKGPNRVAPLFIPMAIVNMASGNVAIKYGAKGICSSVVTACASGTNAIGEAFRYIQMGYADVLIAGGAEAPITPLALAGFTNLTALTNSNEPNKACTPFDLNRSGFVMGEGAGILLLEELEHAVKRGAKIYGEVTGYGFTCDAYHMTAPSPDAEGAARAIEQAINDADVALEEISYINAHGTSTPLNDKLETDAIKKVFGELAYKVPISSTKSMTGHLLGAAGAIEAIISIKAIEEGYIPATIGYETKDPECDLDYVPNQGRKQDINCVISNSFGFGGHNACLLFKKFNLEG